MVLWGPICCISKRWSGIVFFVPLGSTKILLLSSELYKLLWEFRGVGAIHLYKVNEVFWCILKWLVWWVSMNLGVFFFLILLCYAILGWVSFVSVIYKIFRGVAGILSLVLFYYGPGVYFYFSYFLVVGGSGFSCLIVDPFFVNIRVLLWADGFYYFCAWLGSGYDVCGMLLGLLVIFWFTLVPESLIPLSSSALSVNDIIWVSSLTMLH